MVASSELAQEAMTSDSKAARRGSQASSSLETSNKNSSGGGGNEESSGNQVGTTNQHHQGADSSQVISQTFGVDSHPNSNKNKRTTTNQPTVAVNSSKEEPKKPNSAKTTTKAGEMSAKKQQNKKETKTKNKKNKKGANKDSSKDDNVAGGGSSNGTNEDDISCRRDSGKPAVAVVEPAKQKSLVDELKLFQNNQLLNQLDPIQHLHIQLSQLNKGDDEDENNNYRHRVASSAVYHQMPVQCQNATDNPEASSRLIQGTNDHYHHHKQQQPAGNGQPPPPGQWANGGQQQFSNVAQYANEENIFTVKKGVLWQQQQYDKFHQRLFSRWKKRYFILTTDYLVCFKRSAPKVGRSEMGKFLYKTALGDVTKIERLKPKKSDKGAIILHINKEFNLILWSKENLDDWMFMLTESIERNRLRKSQCQIVCQNQNQNQNINNNATQLTTTPPSSNEKSNHKLEGEVANNNNIHRVDGEDFYENTGNNNPSDQVVASSKFNHLRKSEIDGPKSSVSPKRSSNVVNDDENLSSSQPNDDRKIRSQTITKQSRESEVQPLTKRGSIKSQEQQQQQQHPEHLIASENDCKQRDENGDATRAEPNGRCLDSSSQASTVATLSRNGSDEAKKDSIERERRSVAGEASNSQNRGDGADEAAQNGNQNDSVQASGRHGDGTKVIYDPTTSNDDSSPPLQDGRRRTSEQIGATTKVSNQTTADSDDSSKNSKGPTEGNRSSFKQVRKPQLRQHSSKESSASSSSLSERGKRRSSNDESLRDESLSSEQWDSSEKPIANERRRSEDKQKRIEMTSGSANGPPNNAGQHEFNKEKTDKKCNSSRHTRDSRREASSPMGGEKQAVCDALPEVDGTTNSFQVKPAAANPTSGSRMANRPLPTPATNLIRRDDSWQSLVSLTCAGKATPVAMQVAQRSLYAQHIMPQLAGKADMGTRYKHESQQQQDYTQNNSPSGGSRRQSHGIESSITPCRGPFLRQQSAQSSIQGDRFRPLLPLPAPPPPIGGGGSSSGQKLASASFDLATGSPMHPTNQANNTTSYQQKLLQLQLLHNSNNVDYIRHNNNNNNHGDISTADYQIYGPESTNYGYGYGYGYSSMRSNLKSAASEFSFIRPSSSGQATQSTLPHPHPHPHPHAHNNNNNNNNINYNNRHHHQASAFVLDNQSTRHPEANHHQRSSLILASPITNQKQSDTSNNDPGGNCMSPMAKQFLVNPVTGERIINQQLRLNGLEQQQPLPFAAEQMGLVAPVRDLPLKPNKKRAAQNDGQVADNNNNNHLPKSSSLTSIIACFFRRAFSRRSSSKKSSKRRSKLAESCSSSLGAFEDGYANAPMVASAFSTGSKSVDGAGRNNNNIGNSKQSPRMIDMIEAFTNKTHANENSAPETIMGTRLAPVNRDAAGHLQRPQYSGNVFQARGGVGNGEAGAMSKLPMVNQPGARNAHLNQFGSPLHKSNSISATMGLSFVHDTQLIANGISSSSNYHHNNASFLYDNAMMAASGGSPMLMRSNRVLSANLTSLALKQQHHQTNEFGLDHQSFLSPRNSNRRSEHLPRPSSIYGQPSMISSPIISDRSGGGGGFGIHRNSLHNQTHHFRDRSQPPGGGAGFPDVRRHHQQMMKVPFPLDTTREVAEELSSPIAESAPKLLDYGAAMDNMTSSPSTGHQMMMMVAEQSPSVHGGGRYLISASPSSGKLNHRQAVVNPILQSPTMGTIYDNHPSLPVADSFTALSTSTSSYSHYDNHNHHPPPFLMGRGGQPQPSASPSLNQHQQQIKVIGLPASPRVHKSNHFEDPYSSSSGGGGGVSHGIKAAPPTINQSQTPSHHHHHHHHHRLSSCGSDITVGPPSMGGVAMIRSIDQGKKPSAIVAPSNQNHILQASQSQNHFRNDLTASPGSSPIVDHHNHHHHQSDGRHKQQAGMEPPSRSPMLSRRAGSQNHYQQSPLVSSQTTRVLNKGDGVQATVSMVGRPDSIGAAQPVINIAGAPGVNLEPSLAASLLRGTNINAYECSTFDRLTSGQSKQSNSKTFLVSTRLSKSMAYGHGTSSTKENGSDTSIVRDESSVSTSTTTCMRSSRDELSSGSGSRSINSSERSGSSRIRSSNPGTNSSSHEDQDQDEISGSDTKADKSVILANRNNDNQQQQRRTSDSSSNNHRASRRKRRAGESSGGGQLDDEINSRSDSLEKPDEKRNWITSKLVE